MNKNLTINNKRGFKPLFVYEDILMNKSIILNDNKNKSGIYRWINKKDNKSYIGSAVDLRRRLKWYFSIKALENKLTKDTSLIYRALLKHGHFSFRLEILEYCNKDVLLEREQYYIDNIKPEYNILKVAGSSLGFKHSPETLIKFKIRSLNTEGYNTIVVNQKNGSRMEYKSIREAARALNINNTTILDYANTNKLIKNTYLIISSKPINKLRVSLPLNAQASNDGDIKIFNSSTNSISQFSSKRSVAKYLSLEYNVIISATTVSIYIKSGKLYKGKYKIYI